MRVIKFRGRDVHTGEYVFGFYTTGSDDKSFIIINSAQGQYLREVKPDSVAQLVGYDANGREVYEGDTVIWNDLPMTAKFITNISGGEVLKEADQ